MIITNLTPDTIDWLHEGIAGKIKPGEIKEFSENRGKHILNKLDRKGLLQLNYGDDIEELREKAIQLWKEFWTRQVQMFNQDNERRRNTQREYVDPNPEVDEHAKRLGLELVGPWTVKPTESAELTSLREKNATLEAQVGTLAQQVKSLVDMVKKGNVHEVFQPPEVKVELSKGGEESQEDPEDTEMITPGDPEKLIAEFAKLPKDRFAQWAKDNKDRVQSAEFPPAVKKMVIEKWERLVKGEPFPIEHEGFEISK